MRWLLLLSLLLVLTLARAARADSGSNKAAAEALFSEGRALVAKGRCDEAIPKFQASQRLDPGVGTSLNLAECYEQTGKTASAWAEYREAMTMARASGSTDREELARSKAKELEGKLSRLAISLAEGANVDGLRVTRDGEEVDSAAYGVPIPVDPGQHVIEASAPGKSTWSAKVEVGAGASSERVEVPKLEDAAAVAAPDSDSPSGASKSSGSGQRTVALVVGGVGVVGVALGTVFGLQASSSWKDAESACKNYPYECGTEGVSKADDAGGQATISTIAFIAGGVCLAGAAVLWFTAGSGEEKQVSVGVGPGSLRLRGSF
ncbi:MAG TPA: tetratricopeptide repeat protein [Polyangiaceae bacterium]